MWCQWKQSIGAALKRTDPSETPSPEALSLDWVDWLLMVQVHIKISFLCFWMWLPICMQKDHIKHWDWCIKIQKEAAGQPGKLGVTSSALKRRRYVSVIRLIKPRVAGVMTWDKHWKTRRVTSQHCAERVCVCVCRLWHHHRGLFIHVMSHHHHMMVLWTPVREHLSDTEQFM